MFTHRMSPASHDSLTPDSHVTAFPGTLPCNLFFKNLIIRLSSKHLAHFQQNRHNPHSHIFLYIPQCLLRHKSSIHLNHSNLVIATNNRLHMTS